MNEKEVTLAPSGYVLVKDMDDRDATIYLYDAGGDKIDWRHVLDENYDEWDEHFKNEIEEDDDE